MKLTKKCPVKSLVFDSETIHPSGSHVRFTLDIGFHDLHFKKEILISCFFGGVDASGSSECVLGFTEMAVRGEPSVRNW